MRAFTKEVGGVKTTFEISARTVAAVSTIVTLINILANLATHFIMTPNNRIASELLEKNFRVQVLQRILESPNAKDRANSLQLLIYAGVLKDEDDHLMDFSKDSSRVPLWETHPLETITGQMVKTELPGSSVAVDTSSHPVDTKQPNAPSSRVPDNSHPVK